MPEINVRPMALEAAAGTLTAGAEQVRAARDALAGAGGAAEATGSGAAAASYARMHTTWMNAMGVLGELMVALGQATGQAAGDYETTDATAFPEGAPRGDGTP
jgi:WXG100 family type VII secretion target